MCSITSTSKILNNKNKYTQVCLLNFQFLQVTYSYSNILEYPQTHNKREV